MQDEMIKCVKPGTPWWLQHGLSSKEKKVSKLRNAEKEAKFAAMKLFSRGAGRNYNSELLSWGPSKSAAQHGGYVVTVEALDDSEVI